MVTIARKPRPVPLWRRRLAGWSRRERRIWRSLAAKFTPADATPSQVREAQRLAYEAMAVVVDLEVRLPHDHR